MLPPVKLKNMFDAKLSEILTLTADECRGGLDDIVFDNTFYVQENSGNSAISSSSSGGGNWWESKLLPVEDVQDLNIPTMGVPPPSADVEYASWGSSFESGSGDKTWGLDAGWDGYNFEWYSQEVEENNSVGKPSEKIQNDGLYSSKYEDGNSDWFGSSQWVVGVRIANSGSTTKIGVSLGVGIICLLGTIF